MTSPHLCGAAIAVLASLTSLPAGAQEPCPGTPEQPIALLTATAAYSLEDVLGAVRAASPEIRTAALEAVAQQHEARQAGLWTNPVLSLEVEDFGGNRFGGGSPLSGFDSAETTLSIGQTFRLGNKRRAERRAALARAALAEADRDATLRSLEREAAMVFYELAAAEQASTLAHDAAALAEQLAEAVKARVDAGKSPRTALERATAAKADAEAAAAAAAAQAQGLAFTLSSFWGGSQPARIATADMLLPLDLPSPELVAERVREHPRLRFAEADRDARLAEHRAARANAYPDLTAAVGVRRFEADGSEALVASVSVPFPIFDRNQGNRRAAKARARATDYRAGTTAARLVGEAQRSLVSARTLDRRRAALVDEALPAARNAAEAARIGYRAGKFDLTTALDAQTTLIGVQRAVIGAGFAARTAEIDVRALSALPPFSLTFCQETDR